MAGILIVYSSTDGHTRAICERLGLLLESERDRVTLVAIEEARAVQLSAFDKIVIGARIRYGRHSALVRRFVATHAAVLMSKPSAFFSVNLTARKAGKDRPENNPYLRKFLKQTRWRPREVDVFAGKLDYRRYGFFDLLVIRLIMWLTNGPTDPATTVEFTDWQRVEGFAERIAAMG